MHWSGYENPKLQQKQSSSLSENNEYKGILSDFLVSILGNRRHQTRTNNDTIALLQARFRVTNVDRQQLISSCVCCADSGTTTDQTNVAILVVFDLLSLKLMYYD